MMICIRVFSFLKNFLIFLIGRLHKEWDYTLGNGRNFGKRASERGDLYAKQLIEKLIHDGARKYDPYIVDGSSAFSHGKTSVALEEARVTGLSTLHRTNACFLIEAGGRVFVNMNVGAGPLTYQREIVFKFGDSERKAAVLVSVMDIKVSIYFSAEKETGRNGVLLNFAINELNGFKPSINGLGYFDWTINLFLRILTLVLGRVVRNLLENELEQYILAKLPKYQFPVEGAYRNGTEFNIPHEYIQNKEALLAKIFRMKQNHENQMWSRVSPIAKNGAHEVGKRDNSMEYGSEKAYGFNLETTHTKSSRDFLQTNERTTEVNRCFPERSAGLCSESLSKNSCNESSTYKFEEIRDRVSALSKETSNVFMSLDKIMEKLDSITHVTDSWPQRIMANNRLKDSVSSTPKESRAEKPEVEVLMCERLEKESKKDDFSQMLQDSCEHLAKRASEDFNENTEQSKLLDDTFSKIHERSCEKNVDENALDVTTELPTSVVDSDSRPWKKIDLSQIDVNRHELEAEPINAETGRILDLTLNFISEIKKDQFDQAQKIIEDISKELKVRIDGLNGNQQDSDETCKPRQSSEEDLSAPNLDLKLRSAEIIQNDSLNPCIVDQLPKDLNVLTEGFGPENGSKIEDSESITSICTEMPETLDDRVDDQTNFQSNIISASIEPEMIKVEKSFDSETETEAVSANFQFSEKHEGEANEVISFKHVDGHSREDELNKDSLHKAEEGYTLDSWSGSEKLNATIFQNEDIERNKLLEDLACSLSERDIDCIAEFSSIAGLKLNADSRGNDLAEAQDVKSLYGLLQEEIIAETRKLKSNVELDSEDDEYSGISSPVLSCKNLECETEESEECEVNRLLQKESIINDFQVTCLLEDVSPHLFLTESSILDYEALYKLATPMLKQRD